MGDDSQRPPSNPRARDDVVFRRVGDDWLLFDPRSREIHVLNLSAALAWSFCDGTRTGAEVAAAVGEAFRDADGAESPSTGTSAAEDGIAAVLDDFRAKGLLEEVP